MSILHSRETQLLTDRLFDNGTRFPIANTQVFKSFVREYFRGVPYEDLKMREIADLEGSVLAHWNLGLQREAEQPSIRVYNPDVEQHGWQSPYTILEVVTDDIPFLVDSISMLLNRMGLTIHLSVHPAIRISRDSTGQLQNMSLDESKEAYIHIEFDKRTQTDELTRIESSVMGTLGQIRVAYSDWHSMRTKMQEVAEEIQHNSKVPEDEAQDDQAPFCNWLADGNFAFFGYCEFNRTKNGKNRLDKKSTLGILRAFDDINKIIPSLNSRSEADDFSLLITKANTRSLIHRPSYMDLIEVPKFPVGSGVRIFAGLFASTAYNRSARNIPLLRRKMDQVIEQSGLPADSYDGRFLMNIIDTYPRDILFRISADELFADAASIVELQERQRVRVLLRRERYGRFFSVLVYLPRERYSRDLRLKIQEILMNSLWGSSSQFDATFSESILVRINYTIHTDPSDNPVHALEEIQKLVEHACQTWTDQLTEAIVERYGEEKGMKYVNKYASAFSAAYQEDFTARTAATDIERVEQLDSHNNLGVVLYRPWTDPISGIRLKIFSHAGPISPSDALPIIENAGLRVLESNSYALRLTRGTGTSIHDYSLEQAEGLEFDLNKLRHEFEEALVHIWKGEAENDGFNRMILNSGLKWREVVVLRAYCRFLQQIGSPYSVNYMIETLLLHPHMTTRLVHLFNLRFDPNVQEQESKVRQHIEFVESRLETVQSLDEDMILRGYLNAIMSTVRTNFFQSDANGRPLDRISFKIDSRKILKMPEPRPLYEIFVYSTRTEAIHLRGGKVARGGIRWSDRREDFRTEVLGLQKAQMVKNAVIVPVGSKGGFIVKRPPSNKNQLHKEVVECYKTFIRGMLDITDNLVAGDIVPPKDVERYDDDDPYLVVAADKGTATFSDIANQVSEEYGFWLGDAFASGGSTGYDHKAMGITARGGWESVKRHFHEFGKDCQKEPFTAVGIGDMSGDVFGNGMLLSQKIELLGAFNHMEIFLDPNPDPEASFNERERLFNLQGQTWSDYNPELISQGGGVFDRKVKAISVSPEIQKAFDIRSSKLTPSELIKAMLKAPVDLIWNGGIGTYVKAQSESHQDVGDRANDSLRVNGKELRCRVIGEGGNLGMTQLGRVEYCRSGGLCYADFIDNSGGVDCSDHEVNIKILLNEIVSDSELTVKQRNRLLVQMTEVVGEHVISDNYEQAQAVSMIHFQALSLLPEHARFIRALERSGALNRELEFLPDNEEMQERENEKKGLTMPEISVLLAYSKLTLYQELLESDVPEDEFLGYELKQYFPERLSKKYGEIMARHPLRREIVSTRITNSILNQVGPTFVFRIHEITQADYPEIARAYTAAREIFSMREVWQEIKSLDTSVGVKIKLKMLVYAGGLVERATLWLLHHCQLPLNVRETVDYYKEDIATLAASFPGPLSKSDFPLLEKILNEFTEQKVPPELAQRIAGFVLMSTALDIVEISKQTDKPMNYVATAYFEVGARLDLMWIRDQVAELSDDDHWHSLAKSRLRDDIHNQQYEIAADVVKSFGENVPQEAVSSWISANELNYRRLTNLINELKSTSKIDFATLSVAISEVHTLSRRTSVSSSEEAVVGE